MRHLILVAVVLPAVFVSTSARAELCDGKDAGSVSFYKAEITRDSALPAAVSSLKTSDKMFMLMCLTEAVGPQKSGGEKFRIDLYVDGRQTALTRPGLSKPRKEIIIELKDSFRDAVKDLSAGTHELRFQAVSETLNGKKETEVNLDTGSVTTQKMRSAGYLADGKIKVLK
jgi:hypothetical protein